MKNWSSRKSLIPSLALSNQILSACKYTNPLCRLISKILNPLGVEIAFCRYQSKIEFYSGIHDKRLYKYSPKGDFINIGSGGFYHRYWTNIDLPAQSEYYKKLQGTEWVNFIPCDLNNGFKDYPNKPLASAYISHTLEHLPLQKGFAVLQELYNRLLPGGVIRVALPYHEKFFENAKMSNGSFSNEDILNICEHVYTKLRLKPEKDVLSMYKESTDADSFSYLAVKAFPDIVLADITKPEYHLSLWSKSIIYNWCKNNNIKHLYFLNKGETHFPPFTNQAVFDTTEPQHSLYFEIVKP